MTVEARAAATTKAAIAADPTVSVSPTGVDRQRHAAPAAIERHRGLGPAEHVGSVLPASTTRLGVSASLPAGLTSGVIGMVNSTAPRVTVSSLGTASINSAISQLPIGTTFSSSTGTGTSTSTSASTLASRTLLAPLERDERDEPGRPGRPRRPG